MMDKKDQVKALSVDEFHHAVTAMALDLTPSSLDRFLCATANLVDESFSDSSTSFRIRGMIDRIIDGIDDDSSPKTRIRESLCGTYASGVYKSWEDGWDTLKNSILIDKPLSISEDSARLTVDTVDSIVKYGDGDISQVEELLRSVESMGVSKALEKLRAYDED